MQPEVNGFQCGSPVNDILQFDYFGVISVNFVIKKCLNQSFKLVFSKANGS